MNSFGLGMLVGFLAFSDDGAKIIRKIAEGVKNAAQRGGKIIDRYEKLDSGQDTSEDRQQAITGSVDEPSGTEKLIRDATENVKAETRHTTENPLAIPQRAWLPIKT